MPFKSALLTTTFFVALVQTPAPAIALVGPEGEEETEAKPEGEVVLGEQRIPMAPMNVSLFEANRLAARVNIELVIEVKDVGDVSYIKQRLPQLRSDFLTALNQLARERFSTTKPIEPDLIKYYVMAYAERRIGPGKIDVFVQQAYIQPL